MGMRKLRKGDDVIVNSGRDKGKRGTVIGMVGDQKVTVEGVNVVKRHTKANPQQGLAGGIVAKEVPIHVSNISLYNAVSGKADRIGIKTLEDGKKVRFFKSSGEVVDV
jgi:large subunit ribosomal protein L24